MRAHAHVENGIERLKDPGPARYPFTSLEADVARTPGAYIFPVADRGRRARDRRPDRSSLTPRV